MTKAGTGATGAPRSARRTGADPIVRQAPRSAPPASVPPRRRLSDLPPASRDRLREQYAEYWQRQGMPPTERNPLRLRTLARILGGRRR